MVCQSLFIATVAMTTVVMLTV